MRIRQHFRWGLGVAGALMLCGCGSGGGTNPAAGASAGAAAALNRYFDALRRLDVAGVSAALAPDYHYDPGLFDPRNPFDRPAGLRYRSLDYHISALTTAGQTATARVTTTFEGNLNLEILRLGLGRPLVVGDALSVIELELRGVEWKLTAVRTARATYRDPKVRVPQLDEVTLNGLLSVPTLADFSVNGQTSLDVAPGTPLKFAGKSLAPLVLGAIGVQSQNVLLEFDVKSLKARSWELHLPAPSTPSRFLAYAFSVVLFTDSTTGALRFLTGDQVTVPVTVTGAP